MTMASPNGPSVGELLADLARDTGTLVRDEVRLAKVEVGQKATDAAANVGFVLAGGAFIHAGLIALGLALILGLTAFMPLWAAATLVGVVIVGVGWMLLAKGFAALQRADLVPTEAVQLLEGDKRWAKEQVQ
jgi:hypothetical protein